MNKLTAMCGLDCEKCEAFIATKNNDMGLKSKLAEKWGKLFKIAITAEDINCDGCRIDGRHIGYCRMCEIRKCGMDKKIESCALCSSLDDCTKLNDFFKMMPAEGSQKIKEALNEIKISNKK